VAPLILWYLSTRIKRGNTPKGGFTMRLENLISYLEALDPKQKVSFGFNCPHSYRGDYSELAFEPCKDTTVGNMLGIAKDSLGKEFIGYKGGDFEMGGYTRVYLANYGDTGEGLSVYLLDYMVGKNPADRIIED
jgi:hypothetical protein